MAAGVPAVDVAGAKPLNWVRLTPDVDVSELNWLSNEDSSASTSIGVCTLGICVLIFWRSAQLLESRCCSVRSAASFAWSAVSWPCSWVSWACRLDSLVFWGEISATQSSSTRTSVPAPISRGTLYSRAAFT